jgi:hypothetical protein
MSVAVTLHIYSGRPDPAWELSDSQARELINRLGRLPGTTLSKPPGLIGQLGYRGFSVQAVQEPKLEPHLYVHGGIVDLARFDLNKVVGSPDLEDWLLSTAGNAVDDTTKQYVSGELTSPQFHALSASVGTMSVPVFDPGKWNNDPNIRTRNNCYNYANDKITNTFAQPGRGSGSMYTSIDCGAVGAAAQRDGQIPVASASSTPAQGHFIALVIWPGSDYHWYRLDANAMWSHKPGQTSARNTDNSGRLISDPKTCNRGPYTVWCGYYHCIPANTRIA